MVTDKRHDGLHSCYVLHRRDYRNSSLLVELFSRDKGRIGAVAKGARAQKSPLHGSLEPFRPLLVGLSGRGELLNLTSAEAQGCWRPGGAQTLYCGLYLNEMLMRLLERDDAHERLFDHYAKAVDELQRSAPEPVLRRFELQLLQELGYGLQLDREADSGEPIQAARRYRYLPEHGPVSLSDGNQQGVLGSTLISLSQGLAPEGPAAREARDLIRGVLAHYLGNRPLKSRELFLSATSGQA